MTSAHWALGLEYDGSAYHGWQRQVGQISVQATLEDALSRVADRDIRVIASGRTDTGVHATAQVVSFSTTANRPAEAWIRGATSLTPNTLSVRWARAVPAHFHARYSATARRYQYVLMEADGPVTLGRGQVSWARTRLDDRAMHRGAQALVGEHDFTSFRAASCQSRSAYRCVHGVAVHRFGSLIVIDITANAFLQHMVRNIAGALMQIGSLAREESWVAELLRSRSRPLAGPTAPPDGLYLVDVRYPPEFDIPQGMPPPILRALGDIW